jgi:hypothetical protein
MIDLLEYLIEYLFVLPERTRELRDKVATEVDDNS